MIFSIILAWVFQVENIMVYHDSSRFFADCFNFQACKETQVVAVSYVVLLVVRQLTARDKDIRLCQVLCIWPNQKWQQNPVMEHWGNAKMKPVFLGEAVVIHQDCFPYYMF